MATDTKQQDFDMRLAVECAEAFALSTGVGCAVSGMDGEILHRAGYSCSDCTLCDIARRDPLNCIQSHIYGTMEAERFGGKYIYLCTMGLTCFASPILGQMGSAAKLIAGPILMVDPEDYIAFDLQPYLEGELLTQAIETLDRVPRVTTDRVTAFSNLLFMSVGFLNNVSASARMLETQSSDLIQGQITAYIQQLKGEPDAGGYPLETERQLMESIAESDTIRSQALLNELLGYIFFASGGNFQLIKSRVYELLVLISRAAVNGGADPDDTLAWNNHYLLQIQNIHDIESLCFWLTKVMNRFSDSVLRLEEVRHVDVLHKAIQYMRTHYTEKITLEDVANLVYLSPSYFSKIFKAEMGCNFNTYLNRLRIEKSKVLLRRDNARLVDVAAMVGFEDQSYFTKVFKRITGISPNRYKDGAKTK
ncbi:MAG: AraC family transcriptional regulator [Oscillospiraceae bacterium]